MSVFTALHYTMHGGIIYEKNVCPSVCPSVRRSVKRVNCDKTKETSTHVFIPYERPIIVVFQHEEWLVDDAPLYLKFLAKLTPFLRKRRFLIDFRS